MTRGIYGLSGVAALALSLAACAVGPNYSEPDLPVPQDFVNDYRPDIAAGEDQTALWWQGFDDPVLDRLVDTALTENVELGIGLARLREVDALVRAERSDLFPQLDGFIEGQASETLSDGNDGAADPDGPDGPVGFDGDDFDSDGASASGGLAFSFVPDIFGRERRGIEQARATAAAEAFGLADLRRLTAAAVAERYIELRRTNARLQLLETSLDLQQQTLDIVEARLEAGLSADLDVRRAEADLARTRAQRGTLDIDRASAAYTLSVLTGQPPDPEIVPSDEDDPIPSYDGGARIGVPADLLRQRPDLRAAEAQLIAATAAIGVETADLYPSLSLPGQITADLDGGDFSDTIVATLSATLDIPLFDAGRRRAEITAAEFRAEQALLTYQQALLDALADVETALVSLEAFERRREDLNQAVEASASAFEQLKALYREGLASFIDVLDAQRTLIESREAYVDSEAALATATVALYRALGAPTGPQQVPS